MPFPSASRGANCTNPWKHTLRAPRPQHTPALDPLPTPPCRESARAASTPAAVFANNGSGCCAAPQPRPRRRRVLAGCERPRRCRNQTGEEVLGQAAERLAMLIQNLHHLMGFTTVRKFEHCTHNLFRRYITVCSLLGDAKRARSAWRALERTGHITMLQDVYMNMVYIETLLRASRTVRTGDRGEYLDAAMQCAPVPTCGLYHRHLAGSTMSPLPSPRASVPMLRTGCSGLPGARSRCAMHECTDPVNRNAAPESSS